MGKALTFCEIDYDFCRYRFAAGGSRPDVAGYYGFFGESLSGISDDGAAPDLVTVGDTSIINLTRPSGTSSQMLRLGYGASVYGDFTNDFSNGFSVSMLVQQYLGTSPTEFRFRLVFGGLFEFEQLGRVAWINGEEFAIPSQSQVLTINGDRDAIRVYADQDMLIIARNPTLEFGAPTRLEATNTGSSFVSPRPVLDGIVVATRQLGLKDRARMISVYDVTGRCTATVGTPCYNTRSTCRSPSDYNPEPKVIRFVDPTDYAPVDIDAIPSIRQISTTPARIRPGDDLGERASISIGFNDHPYHDRGLDPYVDQRDYDPAKQGTYWGKWRARFPYYRTRALRLIQGELGQPLRDMESRHYVMDSIDGPTADGTFSITAKDVLKLADDKRAQAPRASKGALSSDITATATSATLSPSGIGNSDYPASGVAVIGNEVVRFTRSGDSLTLTRGQEGTTAEEHSDGDTVQLALEFDSQQASVIIQQLLTQYATVPIRFIDLPAWQDEDTTYIGRLYGALITEPTSVRELVAQLIEQVGLSIWWDEIQQLIRFKAIRQPDVPPNVVNDDQHFLAGSIKVKEQPKKRVSQVWVYYGVIDPTEKTDEPRNYRSVYVLGDAAAESPEQYAEPQIRKVFARWISRFNQPGAADMAARILSRYRDAPRSFDFSLAWDSRAITLGNAYDAQTRLMQAPDGSIPRTRVLVTSYERSTKQINVESEEFLYTPPDDLGLKRVVIDADSLNVNAREAYDDIYPAINSGDDVEIIVQSGAIVGSNSTSQPALTIGSWPSGVNITLVVNGRIQGMGGRGGQGGGRDSGGEGQGSSGGPALYTRYPITLEGAAGEIYGGAGGGGGGSSSESGQNVGGGGGGGAGYLGGNGAVGGNGADRSNGDTGSVGTPDEGGRGGNGYNGGGQGGQGGAPGQAGQNAGAAGGQPGNAIDGSSYISVSSSGDIRGAQVN